MAALVVLGRSTEIVEVPSICKTSGGEVEELRLLIGHFEAIDIVAMPSLLIGDIRRGVVERSWPAPQTLIQVL